MRSMQHKILAALLACSLLTLGGCFKGGKGGRGGSGGSSSSSSSSSTSSSSSSGNPSANNWDSLMWDQGQWQ